MIRVLISLGISAIPMLAGDTPGVVPEPSTILLMGGGLAAFGVLAARRNRKNKK
jgi:PEP-CTERM motif-containing protein